MRVVTHTHYTEIYKRLGVTLTDNDERGESFFASRLPHMVDRVRQTLEYGGEGPYVTSRNDGPSPKPGKSISTPSPAPMPPKPAAP